MSSEFDPIVHELLASEDFYRAEQRTELFRHLWTRSPAYTPTELIWRDLLGPLRVKREGTKKLEAVDWQRNTRQSCRDLRDNLNKYFANRGGWHIALALGKRNVGYRLELFQAEGHESPTMAFWRAHLGSNTINLVYGQPWVFLDKETQFYFHSLTSKSHGSREEALSDLEKHHAAELQQWYGDHTKLLQGPDLRKFFDDVVRQRLRPTHNFVGNGEMLALDALASWFHKYPFVAVEKVPNLSINTLKGISPILTGSHRTNKFIDGLLDSPEGSHLRYRLHETKVGYLTITHTDDRPRIMEEMAKTEVCGLPAYEEEEKENGRTIVRTVVPVEPITLLAERTRFAILTRMPKPGGKGSVTMISSDTALAIEQVALALTVEEDQHTDSKPQAANILSALGWPEHPLPASFEIVFSVRIAPGGFEDIAEGPRLLIASSY